MRKLILVDFDGTLIQGDSLKIAYEVITKNTVNFYFKYYLIHFGAFLKALFKRDLNLLRESRRIYLVCKIDSNFTINYEKRIRSYIFENVYENIIKHSSEGFEIVVVSAGFKELIELAFEKGMKYKLIANSLMDADTVPINYGRKVEEVYSTYGNECRIKYAFGNSMGDIPMLKLAEKAFWVDDNGGISEFSI